MSGTCSIAISSAAKRRANSCLSSNAPSGAYTSIIGIVLLPSHTQRTRLQHNQPRKRVSAARVRRSLIRICDSRGARSLDRLGGRPESQVHSLDPESIEDGHRTVGLGAYFLDAAPVGLDGLLSRIQRFSSSDPESGGRIP